MSFKAVFPDNMHGHGGKDKRKNSGGDNAHRDKRTSEGDGQHSARGSRGGRGHGQGQGRGHGHGRGHKDGKKGEHDKSRKAADSSGDEGGDSDDRSSVSSERHGKEGNGGGRHDGRRGGRGRKDFRGRGGHNATHRNAENTNIGGSSTCLHCHVEGREHYEVHHHHHHQHPLPPQNYPSSSSASAFPLQQLPPTPPYPEPHPNSQAVGQSHGGPPSVIGHPQAGHQHVSGQPYGNQHLMNQPYPGYPPGPGQPHFIPGPQYSNQHPVSGPQYAGQPMQHVSGPQYAGQPMQHVSGPQYAGQPMQHVSGPQYVGQSMVNQPHVGPVPAHGQSHSQQSFQQSFENQPAFGQPYGLEKPAVGQQPPSTLPSVLPGAQQSDKTSSFGSHQSLPNLAEEKTKKSQRKKPSQGEGSNPEKNSKKGKSLGQDGDKQNANKEQIKSDPKTNAPNADLDLDEWQQVFTFLLREFDGRTKFGTLMSKKDKLLKGLTHAEAAEWLKRNSSKFLVFEKDGKIKQVSIFFRGAKICFNYRNPKYPRCKNPKCPFFHVCRNFISGSCSYGTECQFSHNFHSQNNIKVCQELALQNFTNEDIRKIVACSSVSVCDTYNRSGCCKEDCLQLHVCANHLQQKCTAGESCNLNHSVKSLEHNQWLLQAFHLMQVPEDTINRMILVRRDEEKQEKQERSADTEDSPYAKPKARKGKKTPNKDLLQELEELSLTCPLVQVTSADGVGLRRQDHPDQGEQVSVTKDAAEGGQKQQDSSQYTYLCEMFSCTGDCPTGFLCPRYHHRSRLHYQWQIFAFGFWRDFSITDNYDIERLYCKQSDTETLEVLLEDIGGLRLTLSFEAMEAIVEDSHGGSFDASSNRVPLRRWSTRSYVDADAEAPLSYYTQWLWFYEDDIGKLVPFHPRRLQYTLEEKYVRGQRKYCYEQGQARIVLHVQEGVKVDLDTHKISKVLRRPAFFEDGNTACEMSPLLLSEAPTLQHPVPSHWSCVDHYQDFELVELDPTGAEYQDVAHKFHATLDKRRQTILSIFRIQNPALWDKYCSTKRGMTPRDMTQQDIDERQLFHGTPTLEAVRGICANNIDFRRSGENVGAKYGKGSYFSTNSFYSHSYTCGTDSATSDRFMFLARVLVGKFTLGEGSFAMPPIREGLKRYDSCVDNQTNPTIFVIFDLAQSYPEYLIQYKDAQDVDKAASKLGKAESVGSLAVMDKGAGVTSGPPGKSSTPLPQSPGIITDSSRPALSFSNLPATDESLPVSGTPRSLLEDASSLALNQARRVLTEKALLYGIQTKGHSASGKDEKCILS